MSVCNYSMNKDFKFHYVFMHIFSFFRFSSLILWDRFLPILKILILKILSKQKKIVNLCVKFPGTFVKDIFWSDDLFTTWLLCRPFKKVSFFYSKKMSTGGKNLHLLKLMMADKSRNSFQNRCRLVKFAYPAMYNVHSRPQGRVLFKLFWHGYHR